MTVVTTEPAALVTGASVLAVVVATGVTAPVTGAVVAVLVMTGRRRR